MMGQPLYYAYCYENGAIGFTQKLENVPTAAKVFAEGHGKQFRFSVEGKSRLAHDNRTSLCPGLPEGDLNGFIRWHKWAFPAQSSYLDNFVVAA